MLCKFSLGYSYLSTLSIFKEWYGVSLLYLGGVCSEFFPPWILSHKENKERCGRGSSFISSTVLSLSRTSVDRELFPAPSLPAWLGCFQAVSIYRLWLLRDVGGWNRRTSRPLSFVCACDVTGRDLQPRLRLRPWGAQRDIPFGTGELNGISTAAGIKKKKTTKQNAPLRWQCQPTASARAEQRVGTVWNYTVYILSVWHMPDHRMGGK